MKGLNFTSLLCSWVSWDPPLLSDKRCNFPSHPWKHHLPCFQSGRGRLALQVELIPCSLQVWWDWFPSQTRIQVSFFISHSFSFTSLYYNLFHQHLTKHQVHHVYWHLSLLIYRQTKLSIVVRGLYVNWKNLHVQVHVIFLFYLVTVM